MDHWNTVSKAKGNPTFKTKCQRLKESRHSFWLCCCLSMLLCHTVIFIYGCLILFLLFLIVSFLIISESCFIPPPCSLSLCTLISRMLYFAFIYLFILCECTHFGKQLYISVYGIANEVSVRWMLDPQMDFSLSVDNSVHWHRFQRATEVVCGFLHVICF